MAEASAKQRTGGIDIIRNKSKFPDGVTTQGKHHTLATLLPWDKSWPGFPAAKASSSKEMSSPNFLSAIGDEEHSAVAGSAHK